MSVDRWNTVLVLGGIRSGKSAFAESLVSGAPSVRYVATSAGAEDDAEWFARIEAHQRRRPQSWSTEETGADPSRLAAVLSDAKPDDTLLVDDLGGWVAALLDPARQPNDDEASVAELAAAVRDCAARVVLVSPEVGLSLVAPTPVGRAFADALGTANQALAAVCDRVVLVVAGQPTWLKPSTEPSGPQVADAITTSAQPPATPQHQPADPSSAAPPTAELKAAAPHMAEPKIAAPKMAEPAIAEDPAAGTQPQDQDQTASGTPGSAPADVFSAPTMLLPLVGSDVVIQPLMDLPMPDNDSGPDAADRLVTLDFPGAGLGVLAEAVEFAAATQATAVPRPWAAVRVLLVAGDHGGGAAAGADPADTARRVADVEAGRGPLARLAGEAGADIEVVRVPESGAMEDAPVLTAEVVDEMLRQGWELAGQAAQDGKDALVLASIGTGTDAVATAVAAATTGGEPVALLPRVLEAGGFYNDTAWMTRCAAVRDALHRIRQEPRGARDILAQIGGADLAVATGVLLGAAASRIPVLLDGPIGIAAGLVARDLAGQARHWCLLPDAGNLHLVQQGADVLGLTPVLDLGLGLGEGANALATLPLLRMAIGLAAALPVHPALLTNPGDAGLSDDLPGGDPAHAEPTATELTDGGGGDLAEAELISTDLIIPNDEDEDFAEPPSDGPGPASTHPDA